MLAFSEVVLVWLKGKDIFSNLERFVQAKSRLLTKGGSDGLANFDKFYIPACPIVLSSSTSIYPSRIPLTIRYPCSSSSPNRQISM